MFGVLFSIFLLLNVVFRSESSFPKDLDMNIQFPPILDRRDGIPTGHLRPLGWQNRAESPVHEESVMLQPEEFWDKYVNRSKPMVTRGLVFGSDAVDKWSDVHLNRAYGNLDIKITERKQHYVGVEEKKVQMSLNRFLKNYRVEDWYLRVIMPEEMHKEVPMPHIISCGPLTQISAHTPKTNHDEQAKLKKDILSSFENKNKFELPRIAQLIEPYLWISAGETSSLLHSHPEHNLHCVMDGRKDFILMPVDQFTKKGDNWRQKLDLYETFPHSSEWYSKIDVDMVNAYKYSMLHTVVWYWASLRAGDCIYIPANYLHQIRSHGRSISASVYFTSLQTENQEDVQLMEEVKKELFSQCPKNAPLFEMMNGKNEHFMWTYTHGERHLKQRNMHANDAKRFLLYLLRNDSSLYFERFNDFYNEITAELKDAIEKMSPVEQGLVKLSSHEVWQDFFKQGENTDTMNRAQIFNLASEINLSRFIKILNSAATFHEREDEMRSRKDEL